MSKLIEALAKIEDVCISTDYEGHFQVSFDRGWVRDGSALIGKCGRGNTIEEAANDYLRQISGQRIVVDGEHIRREFYVIDMQVKEEKDDHQQETI